MGTKFSDYMSEIEAEARVEGPDAVAELEGLARTLSTRTKTGGGPT